MKNSYEIKTILIAINRLVQKSDHRIWRHALENWCDEIEEFPAEVIRDIINSSGGSGSFGDFALYKNLELMYEETVEFCALRHKLFNLCVESLPEVSKNDPMAGEHSDS